LGNNVDHFGLIMTNPTKVMIAPTFQNNVDVFINEVIIPTQIMVEEMAICFRS
jgi:hypothetical protein